MVNVLVEAMDIIFENPRSIFVTMTAMEFIEKGIEINCNQTKYAAKVACAEMRRSTSLTVLNDEKTLLRFRLFDLVCEDLLNFFLVLKISLRKTFFR